jgi:hypothetical protein
MGKAGGSLAWSRRLMAIGVVSSMYGLIPTSIVIALLATAYPVTPWPGWRAIHSTIDVIVYVPVEEWRSNSTQIASVELRRWTTVTLAFTVFVFLGLTADMKKMYLSPFRSVIEQTASFGQTRCDPVDFDPDFYTHRGLKTSIKTVPEQNADVDGQKGNLNLSFWGFVHFFTNSLYAQLLNGHAPLRIHTREGDRRASA